jgi:hypothetical protein
MTIIDFESGKPVRPGYLEWLAANLPPIPNVAPAAPATPAALDLGAPSPSGSPLLEALALIPARLERIESRLAALDRGDGADDCA